MKKVILTGFIFFASVNLLCDEAFALKKSRLREWGQESMKKIKGDFRLPNGLYCKTLSDRTSAYVWGQGIVFGALAAAARVDQSYLAEAEALADLIQTNYWCTSGGLSAYNASAGGCGDRYTDDNAWIVLAMLELYDITGNDVYIQRSEQAMDFIMEFENGTANTPSGGIRWHESNTCGTRTCSTAPVCLANLVLYSKTSKAEYLQNGLRIYQWALDYGLQSDRGTFYEGVHCNGTLDYVKLGYDTAPFLQAAVELYKITDDQQYLRQAKNMAYALETEMINARTNALHQTGKWGGHDMTNAFVDLYEVDQNQRWINLAAGYLRFLHDNCKTEGRYPEDWSSTSGDFTDDLIDQASAARAYWTLARTQGGAAQFYPAVLFDSCGYQGWSLGLDYGSYSLDDLKFRGVLNNSVSSFLLEDNCSVKLYDAGNFSGETLTKSLSDNCLNYEGWGNRASSLKITNRCPVHSITPLVKTGSSDWAQSSVCYAEVGDAVSFKAQTDAVHCSWKGPNGFTSSEKSITFEPALLMHSGVYTAVCTNSCGTVKEKMFKLNVSNPENFPHERSNLALNKQVTADSYISGEHPALAVDGSLRSNSKWCASSGRIEPHWLTVDLGDYYDVDTFVIAHAAAGGEYQSWNTSDFCIQANQDGQGGWEDILCIEENSGSITRAVLDEPKRIRFVRLHITAPTQGTDPAVRIYEFQVFEAFSEHCLKADISGPAGQPDGAVDMQDYFLISEKWRDADQTENYLGDFNGDSEVNLNDLLIFSDRWLSCIGSGCL
ncbi:glycoside hydrolase family 76 protein [Sedimentisphaera salicampi]|uniref:glycoside hydrolase family 76 protein n=1 Tax=Sedimentisphaera salicampi TaxID=1941349 RepID=UPI000B9B886F|nr:glycoside hydrolase family 76 protein [Sedimentisphaera salicampi]OXU15926.1 putative glycosyl hydrolase [Sedimentisphaera salicampi]